MPAAAVIPAPIAYIKVVAVKKLVVEFRTRSTGLPNGMHWPIGFCLLAYRAALYWVVRLGQNFYCEKIRVFKAGLRLNTLAWNNGIGLWFYFVGSKNQSND